LEDGWAQKDKKDRKDEQEKLFFLCASVSLRLCVRQIQGRKENGNDKY
jgi:hypothetical protein